MKIEKITLIEFDESKERQRILTAFNTQKKKRFQVWLLAILDAYIANDWDKAIDVLKKEPERGDESPYEYVHMVIFETLKEYSMAKQMRAALAKKPEADRAVTFPDDTSALLMDMKGLPTSAERYDYPKFRVVAAEAVSAT